MRIQAFFRLRIEPLPLFLFAQHLSIFLSQEQSDRIPFSLPGDRNVIAVDNPLHNVA
jgi:hypothetical protein